MNLVAFGVEEQLSKRGNQLLKLGKVIDWERLRKHLHGFYKRAGSRSTESRSLLVILLKAWGYC